MLKLHIPNKSAAFASTAYMARLRWLKILNTENQSLEQV